MRNLTQSNVIYDGIEQYPLLIQKIYWNMQWVLRHTHVVHDLSDI